MQDMEREWDVLLYRCGHNFHWEFKSMTVWIVVQVSSTVSYQNRTLLKLILC